MYSRHRWCLDYFTQHLNSLTLSMKQNMQQQNPDFYTILIYAFTIPNFKKKKNYLT